MDGEFHTKHGITFPNPHAASFSSKFDLVSIGDNGNLVSIGDNGPLVLKEICNSPQLDNVMLPASSNPFVS